MPKQRKKKKRRRKKDYFYYLPFSYTNADKKQAKLYLIIIKIIAGECSETEFEILRRHIFYRLRHYTVSNREDIFSDFLVSIIAGSANPKPHQINLFIMHRLLNAIKRFKRESGRLVLVEDDSLESITDHT